MTTVEPPMLHALTVEPRTARAGEIVRVLFRTRNLGTQPSPSGTVVFAMGDGLEALGDTEVCVEPVAPDDDVVAAVRARVAAPAGDRAEIEVRAALHVPDAVFGTNACTVIVRSRAVCDGPASGTFVDAIDGDTVRVRAVVVNEGDGPACGARVVVPPPVGCVRTDGAADAALEIERLEPGERAELAFEARIAAPVAEVRADDGEVRFGDGRRVALPVREVLAPAPVIAVPAVVVSTSRRRAEVAINVRNAGWVDASDVCVRIALPAALRPIDGGVTVDGVPLECRTARRRTARTGAAAVARAERAGDRLHIVISAVPARGSARVTIAAAVPRACADTAIGLAVEGHVIEVPFVADPVRDVHVRAAGVPRTVSPGTVASITVRVVNAGDVEETVSIAIAEDSASVAAADAGNRTSAAAARRTIAPGCAALVELGVPVARHAADGDVLARSVVVFDASGTRASTGFALLVRDRAWLSLDDEPVRDDGRVRYAIRNGGSTAARDVAARFGEVELALGSIGAGSTAVVEVDDGTARCGGMLAMGGRDVLELPCARGRFPAAVRAVLRGPETVVAGAPFAVLLEVDLDDAVEMLAIRVPDAAGCRYVPGSALLDGRVLLDRTGTGQDAGGSPLAGDGLRLRGVPGGTRIALTWSLLADPALSGVSCDVAAALDVDGDVHAVAPVSMDVRARDAFAARPAGLRYHVEACTIDPPAGSGDQYEHIDTAPCAAADIVELPPEQIPAPQQIDAPPAPAAVAPHQPRFHFTMRLDAERVDTIARLLHGIRGGGLVAHLFAVRLFFPDAAVPHDDRIAAALAALRGAVGDLFDRLYVKLRIPGFGVSSDDLEDAELRHALVALLDSLPGGVPAGCTDAAHGSPAVLRALIALLPERCDDDPLLAAAIGRHARLLNDVLTRYDGLPLELFDDALARRSDAALDDARADVLRALGARAPRVETAC